MHNAKYSARHLARVTLLQSKATKRVHNFIVESPLRMGYVTIFYGTCSKGVSRHMEPQHFVYTDGSCHLLQQDVRLGNKNSIYMVNNWKKLHRITGFFVLLLKF